MSRPIEQALNNLIPRHPGSLPPELIELASSLLAQSRSKISNLRAEEEIGRTYACANIACERLKTTLNLPSIEPRPPCPPKIYKKLYGHFDQILVSNSRKRTKSSANNGTPTKALPQKQIPIKEKSLEGFRSNRTPKRGLRYGSNKEKEKLPKWVGPAIRKICKEFGAVKAVPHVWAGVESVLYLPYPGPKPAKGEEKMEGKMPALIAAVWFFVMTRLVGKETNGKEYVKRRKQVLEILLGVREDEGVVAKVGEEDGDWEGWENVTAKDVDMWLGEIAEREWNALDWFTNIDPGSGAGAVDEEAEAADEEGEQEELVERASKRVRRAGLGTMMQAKFDYLSDEKRDEYAVWKQAMLAKINDLIAAGVIDEDMDTAEG